MTDLGRVHESLLAGLSPRERRSIVQGLAAAQRNRTEALVSAGSGPDGHGRRPDSRTVQRLRAVAETRQQIAVELSKTALRRPDDRSARRRAMSAWRQCEQLWQVLGNLQRTCRDPEPTR